MRNLALWIAVAILLMTAPRLGIDKAKRVTGLHRGRNYLGSFFFARSICWILVSGVGSFSGIVPPRS